MKLGETVNGDRIAVLFMSPGHAGYPWASDQYQAQRATSGRAQSPVVVARSSTSPLTVSSMFLVSVRKYKPKRTVINATAIG